MPSVQRSSISATTSCTARPYLRLTQLQILLVSGRAFLPFITEMAASTRSRVDVFTPFSTVIDTSASGITPENVRYVKVCYWWKTNSSRKNIPLEPGSKQKKIVENCQIHNEIKKSYYNNGRLERNSVFYVYFDLLSSLPQSSFKWTVQESVRRLYG